MRNPYIEGSSCSVPPYPARNFSLAAMSSDSNNAGKESHKTSSGKIGGEISSIDNPPLLPLESIFRGEWITRDVKWTSTEPVHWIENETKNYNFFGIVL